MHSIPSVLGSVGVITMFVSCTRQEPLPTKAEVTPSHKAAEVAKWASAGWTFEETVGEEIPEATAAVHLASEEASAVAACATTADGEIVRKRFPQDERLYLIVTMDGGQQGTYCLVFSKEQKPSRPQ